MAKIYSRGQNQPSSNPDSLRNLTGIFGPPDDLRERAVSHLEELVAALGAARAFSNNPDAKKLLVKVQHKLLNAVFVIQNRISLDDPMATTAINHMDLIGLTNCINIFGVGLPLSLKKIVPGANKAGSMMHLAQAFAKRTAETLGALTEHDQGFATIHGFANLLATLLQTLERVEYKMAGFEEEYWN